MQGSSWQRQMTERFLHPAPVFLEAFCHTPEMQRLREVGMNCGCEYTAFPRFRSLRPYSRYEHSLGVARIVWDFTGDPAATLAGLFHDIASPPFSHSVDFLFGDALRQEFTERGTGKILRASRQIPALLADLGLRVEDVEDYHRYPIG